jgi:hypothetical protein
MTVAPLRVWSSRRALTNWLGQSRNSPLGNSAFSRTVAVPALIWLSMTVSFPVANLAAPARS